MSRVANRYSKALFEVAIEQNKVETVRTDLESMRSVVLENVDFQKMLTNPLIAERSKSSVVTSLFENRVDELSFRFLHLLTEKRRMDILPAVIDRFLILVQEHQGILSGRLLSARPMNSEDTASVKTQMESITGKTVVLDEQVDGDLIGGFVVKIKDTVIDLSVKTQLEKLRRRLVYG